MAADAGRACKCITCCAALPSALTGQRKSSKTHILAAVPADELPASLKAVLNADEKKEAPLAVVRKEDQIYEKEFEMEMERAKVRLLLTGTPIANSTSWCGQAGPWVFDCAGHLYGFQEPMDFCRAEHLCIVCGAGTLSSFLYSLQTGRSKTTPWGSGYGKLPEGGRLHGAHWVFRSALTS